MKTPIFKKMPTKHSITHPELTLLVQQKPTTMGHNQVQTHISNMTINKSSITLAHFSGSDQPHSSNAVLLNIKLDRKYALRVKLTTAPILNPYISENRAEYMPYRTMRADHRRTSKTICSLFFMTLLSQHKDLSTQKLGHT